MKLPKQQVINAKIFQRDKSSMQQVIHGTSRQSFFEQTCRTWFEVPVVVVVEELFHLVVEAGRRTFAL
jgi:hypothetical protein